MVKYSTSSKKAAKATKFPLTLNDKALISWLKENHHEIKFIEKLPYEAYERTEKLLSAIDKLNPNEDLIKQPELVADVWRNLLGKAIVYLKNKDDREKYHDDEDYGVEKLDEFFKTFQGFEPLLYGAEESGYRDHMSHMLTVFIIGEYLIKTVIGFDQIHLGSGHITIDAAEKEAMWCIMSLTHDLGIALERITRINPKAEDMLKKFGVIEMQGISFPFLCSPLDDLAIKLISSDLNKLPEAENFVLHIQSKYFMKFAEAYERREHGIISCLVLIKNLVYFLETDYLLDVQKPLALDEARQFLIRREILRAIASHSNENIYYLDLPQFSFLLMICDDLHEWGRPRLIEMFGEKTAMEVTVENLTKKEIHYKVALKSKSTLKSEERERRKDENLKYFMRRCEKLRRVLRSAVGGNLRDLKLTFEVSDETETKTKSYKLIHQTPDTVKILEKDKEVSWLYLQNKVKS